MAGDQVPVTPLLEVLANVNEVPLHIGAMLSKVGTTFEFTTTVMVAVVAQVPVAGVNVYVVVAVLFTTGLQVPLMLLVEVVSRSKETPVQTGLT